MSRMNKKDINRPCTSPPLPLLCFGKGRVHPIRRQFRLSLFCRCLEFIRRSSIPLAQGDWQAELCLPSLFTFRPSKRQPPFVLYCHSLLLPFGIVQRLNPLEVRFAPLFQIALNSIGRRPFLPDNA